MVVEYNGKKFLFIHIGGNAGTSIEWYLYQLSHNNFYEPEMYNSGYFKHIDTIRLNDFRKFLGGNQHMTLSEYIKSGIKYDYSFAVIRNPFDRMLAKFFTSPHSKKINMDNAKQLFTNFINEIYEYKTVFAKKQRMHTICQNNYIEYGEINVNYIIQFEIIQESFDTFCDLLKLPIRELIKCNSTSHPLKSFQLYTPESYKKVYINNKKIIDKYYDFLFKTW